MCGLAGFFSSKRLENSTAIISTMTERLMHRGPDDAGIWLNQEDGIALGHRRLAIIDLSSFGHQPMHSQDGRYVLVYNGEIYNFRELKKQLLTKNYSFSGNSDTEVILTLIAEYGLESALKQMSGMFALALWDNKEKTLQLARDRIGEKPLYYGLVDGAFVFASELKAIRAYPNFQNKVNRASLALFLQYGYVPAPHCIFENIYKLTPGSYLTICQATINALPKPKIYWSASQVVTEGMANPLHLTDAEAIQHTDHLLNAAIKSRMVSDVPLGAFLSGGIDSSLIAALMQANSERPIKTFTIGFKDRHYNEAEYAKAVANYLKTDHTELYVDAPEALAVIHQLPVIYDEPFADSSAIPTYLVSKLTKQQVSVCLTGDGGDEIFGGYNRYLLGNTLWKKIALFPYPVRLVIRNLLLSVTPTRWQQVLQLIQLPNIGDKLHKFAAVVAAKSPELFYQQLISQGHATHDLVRQNGPAIASAQIMLQQIEGLNFVEKMMITDTLSYLPDDIMVKVDRAGMALSLETRAPYLDHGLIEFMWQLPLDMKIRNHSTKWLLRQVLSKRLPNHLFDRPKMGFGIPLDAWLRGSLRDWAENLLNKKRIEEQGYLRAEPILEKWQEHLSGKRNWQHQLWTVLMFQAWIET